MIKFWTGAKLHQGIRYVPCSFKRYFVSTRLTRQVSNDDLLTNVIKSGKSAPDTEYVRYTVYDSSGDMVIHGKDIRRLEFMKKYGVAPRDLRKMVRSHTQSSTNGVKVEFVPLLLTRKDCILLNLLNIRALIKCDKLVVFESFSTLGPGFRFNESHSHSAFLKELSTRLKATHPDAFGLPYELRALEAILVDVTGNLNTEMTVHKTVLNNILSSLDKSIERTKLRYLLIESKKLAQFHQKAKLIEDLLDDLLDQDDLLNELYLTENLHGKKRVSFNHQEVELLLESYYTTIGEIVQTVENLMSQIKTSEEIIRFVLDANRNELMLLSLRFTIGLLSTGCIIYVSALYGMNLENFIEESDGGFEAVVITGTIMTVLLFIFCLKQIDKVQKITMSTKAKKNESPFKGSHAR